MSSSIPARLAAAVICLATLVAPFVSARAAAGCELQRRGDWTTIPAPRFPAGAQKIKAFAVDPNMPRSMFVTNGTAVMRTRDSGCSFKQVFVLPEAPSLESRATRDNSVIKSIDISEDAGGLTYLMVEETSPAASHPHVIVSGDFGETWRNADIGLPPNGSPEFLLPAPSNKAIAYLGIDLGGGSVDLLFATTDAGLTWNLRSDLADSKPNSGIMGMTIDPIEEGSLWAWGTSTPPNQAGQPTGREASGLMHSADGGRTFKNVDDFANTPAGPVDVFHARGGAARIVAFIPNQAAAQISTDGGETWALIPAPPRYPVDAVTHMETVETLAATAAGDVFAFHAPSFTWFDLGAFTSGLKGITSDGVLFRLYAHSDRTLEVFDGSVKFPPPDEADNLSNVSLVQSPNSPIVNDPVLSPARKTIAIDAGDSKTVRYRLDLPDRPLPLNVFFLLDTSDSMGATIYDLAESVAQITNQLSAEEIDLKVGIGAYRAYPDRFPPDPPCGTTGGVGPQRCEKNYVFERVLQIVRPGPHVTTALETLESDAGGFYKSHLGALYQLATGAGQDLFPPGPSQHDVKQGLQAEWDKKALKVVVHATDERFGRPKPRNSSGADFGNPEVPDIPSFEEVAAAFDRPGTLDDIYQIGLSISTGPRKDLQQMAALTNTVAPSQGVDCDGDGFAEIAAGQPLVCDVRRDNLDDSHNLVPAIVNTLQAIPKSTNVSLAVKGKKEVIQKISPEVHRGVVEQIANQLVYDVDYRCPLSVAGKKFPIELEAADATGRVLDTATANVVCGDTAVPLVLPPLLALFPPVPAPPPPPVSNVSSTSQAQGQAQAQAGAAYQEEEQPQVAVAAAYKEMLEQKAAMEYEMVAYERRRYPVSPGIVLGAGFLMGACAYAVALARERVQLGRQHN